MQERAEDAAERLAGDATADDVIAKALDSAGVHLQIVDAPSPMRSYDAATKTLAISANAPMPTRRFQALHQIALLSHGELIEATLDLARFHSPEAQNIARVGLANYFAGAAHMPYRAFLSAARETRHDLERLAGRFGASLEQVAHRLSTLQRPAAKGVPFFFVRVDQAGTVGHRCVDGRDQYLRRSSGCRRRGRQRVLGRDGNRIRKPVNRRERLAEILRSRRARPDRERKGRCPC